MTKLTEYKRKYNNFNKTKSEWALISSHLIIQTQNQLLTLDTPTVRMIIQKEKSLILIVT